LLVIHSFPSSLASACSLHLQEAEEQLGGGNLNKLQERGTTEAIGGHPSLGSLGSLGSYKLSFALALFTL
jgi:hypothetical protein